MNLHQILNILNKRMIVIIANVFAKLETLKDFVRALSKKPRFRTRSDSQHVKALQMRRKSPMQALLSSLSIILRDVDLENISASVS